MSQANIWSSTGSAPIKDLSGCISCPEGTSAQDYSDLMSAVENAPLELLAPKVEEWNYPALFTMKNPILEPRTLQCGIAEKTYTVGIGPSSIRDNCPTEKVVDSNITIDQPCGINDFNSTGTVSSGGLCGITESGPVPVIGEDESYDQEFVATNTIGPICLDKNYRTKRIPDVIALMKEIFRVTPLANMYYLERETVKRLIEQSHHLIAAVAGNDHKDYHISQGAFEEEPTSAGSLEFFFDVAERVGTYSPSNMVKVSVSATTMEYILKQYHADHGSIIHTNGGELTETVQNLVNIGEFGTKIRKRSRRRVTQTLEINADESDPIYVTLNQTGPTTFEWDFIDDRIYVPGVDGSPKLEMDPNYGCPCYRCPATGKVVNTYEIIPVISEGAYNFHHFNRNPIAAALAGKGMISSDIHRRISSGYVELFTGRDATDYINARNMFDCPIDNLDKQWIVGRNRHGRSIREGAGSMKKGTAFIIVKLAADCNNLKPADCCLAECPTDRNKISLTPKDTAIPANCEPTGAVEEPKGCVKTPSTSCTYFSTEEETQRIYFRRDSGQGAATIDYAFVDDTAANGTAFTGTDGTLEFEEGQVTKYISFDWLVQDPEPTEEQCFNLVLTGEDLCDGPEVTVPFCIKPCPEEEDEDCEVCGDETATEEVKG